jgi:type IV pilus assembly protein PilW
MMPVHLSRNLARLPRRVAQLGFSLIELMVAIGMALFLAAGLVSTVVTLKGSFNSQDQLTQLQENQRFLLTALTTTVHNAGYFVSIQVYDRNTVFPTLAAGVTPDNVSFKTAQFLSGTDGAAGASDTLDIRYQTASGDTLTNCQGGSNTTGAPVTWTNTYSVNASNQLVCNVSINGVKDPNAAMVLADQVGSMSILYGVDVDGLGGVDTYMTAAEVETANKWGAVLSVQLSITFLDPIKSKPGAPQYLPKPLVQTIAMMNTP